MNEYLCSMFSNDQDLNSSRKTLGLFFSVSSALWPYLPSHTGLLSVPLDWDLLRERDVVFLIPVSIESV